MSIVTPVCMPKWGLSMQEGAILEWIQPEGTAVKEGDELVDIETSKIANVCESPVAGILRRIIAQPGETLPVGGLLAVVAEADVPESDIDAFITEFHANFVPPAEDDEEISALKLSIVDAAGKSLRIGRAGMDAGVPVVLIHGYSGNLNNWLFNIEALSAVAPVIAIDLPGHGGSTKDVGDGSLSELSSAIEAALKALNVDEAHLIGHSLGAAVVARLAIDNPGLARSVTLIAPAGLSATGVSDDFLTGVIDAERARDLKPVLELLLADPAMVTKDMVDDVLKSKRVDGVQEALQALRNRMVDGADAADLRRDLATIPAAQVIASRSDRVVGLIDDTALPPGFKVTWIDNASHMPHLEQAAVVNALLVEVVSS